MADEELSELARIVERAVETIAKLHDDRDSQRQQIEALRKRIGQLEEGRRTDRAKIERLALIEGERNAVRQRLGSLLSRLETAGNAE